ncbi:hypothetical protein [Streptomyces sp. S.PB5]|uniref:hypothetical protein n=1 Tax=Streptomyces sp. S.PB5 TaxID=3020844 RepID=UPI0025B26A86|nr:hypothetical protein [Streptomyces sp. S.PB5]MDN3023820.1 hypothetical protein [Streptomyces sp. S.PB5]
MTTTTNTQLPKPAGPRRLIPAFLDTSPAAPLIDEYRTMLTTYNERVAEHTAAEKAVTTAAETDIQARAAALRAGRTDPGPQGEATAREALQDAHSNALVAAEALAQVWSDLRRRLAQPDMQEWAQTRGHDVRQDAGERLAAALADASTAIAELAQHAGEDEWLKRALAYARGEASAGHSVMWPQGGVRQDLIRINVQGNEMNPADILSLLAHAAREATA